MEQRNRSRKPKPKPKTFHYGKNFMYRLSGSILLIVLAVYIKENVPQALQIAKEALNWSLPLP